jgi:hypothetical protein
MKNLNLIYLIPAMMLLVWGCGEEKPKDPHPIPLVAKGCVYVSNTNAGELYSEAQSDANEVNVNPIWNSYSDQNISVRRPMLYGASSSNSTGYQLIFSLNNQVVTNNKAKQKLVTINEQRILVLAIEVTTPQSNGTQGTQFFEVSGGVANGVDAVIAIIEYPYSETPTDINYTVLQFNQCSDPAASFTNITESITLSENGYKHDLTVKNAPHVFPSLYNDDSLGQLDLLIPTEITYRVNRVEFKRASVTDGIKLLMEVTLEENKDKQERLYTYSGNLKQALELTADIMEIEIIVISPGDNGVKKGVKIIKQAADDRGGIIEDPVNPDPARN